MRANTILSRLVWLFTGIVCLPGCVWAQNGGQPYIRFTFFTGGDDLRNGQNVTISLYTNASVGSHPEFLNVSANDGRGSANNTSFSYVFPFGNGWRATDFNAVKILHDGNGHNAFEGYDNWNLDRFRVVFVDPNATPRQTVLLDLLGQPLVRFTGDKRGQSWNFSPQVGAGTGNSTNSQEMSSSDLMRIKMAIRSESSDPLGAAKTWIRQANRTMTTAQVRSIMDMFSAEGEKFSIIQACYSYVSNRQSLVELTDAFSADSYRRQLATMAQGR